MGERLPLPYVPGVVSNGEFAPPPPGPRARQIEAEALRIAEDAARRRGMDRRRFLQTAGGMAAMLTATNLVAACAGGDDGAGSTTSTRGAGTSGPGATFETPEATDIEA